MSGPNPELMLKGLLARIFSDGVVEPKERAELDALRAKGDLTLEQIEKVMVDFFQKTLTYSKADGVITDKERMRLRAIVDELALPESAVPAEVRDLLKG